MREPDAGGEPDAGRREPDAGRREPDAGMREPDAGMREPDAGMREPEGGKTHGVAARAAISVALALPPLQTTATRRPAKRSGRLRTPASGAAPAPSARVCA